MSQFGGKDSKRHFTVVIGNKEHGIYVSSTPSSAAKKAVTKLCAANKSKKVEFSIREITQGSKKKTYGPYNGYIEKLKEPVKLKGRVIKYKPVVKLSRKSSSKKGGMIGSGPILPPKNNNSNSNINLNNPHAGPARAPNNSNSNDEFGLFEQIAWIEFREPERFENTPNTDELYEKSEELKKLDNDIFYISIDDTSRNNWHGRPAKKNIFINFNNYLKAKKKENFKENLNELIELLKFFKEAENSKLMDTKFYLFTPDESFSDEHNEILIMLSQLIEPIGPTVFQNSRFRNVPAPNLPNNFPPGNAPPLNNTNFRPAPKYPNNFPPGSAPPFNNR